MRALAFALLTLCAASSVVLAPATLSAQAVGADEEARRLFQEGREAYAAGSFEDAMRAFRRAYLLSNRPALLYNVGQTALRLGQDREALDAFEAYLRLTGPDEPNRPEVTERVRILQSMLGTQREDVAAQEADTPAPASTGSEQSTGADPPLEPRDAPREPSWAPWLVVGGGAAVAVVGGVLMGIASSDASRVTGARDGDRWADLSGTAESASAMWTAGQVLVGAGAAVLAAGLVWGVVELSAAGGSEREVQARVLLGPGSVMVEGSF